MFKSAAEEITEWADQCRRWARGARSKEQRLILQNWGRLFEQAALDAEDDFDVHCLPGARVPSKF